MSYATYALPDGTDAGYAVTATCGRADCGAEVYRGLDALCGPTPAGHAEADDPMAGCGAWHCAAHHEDHECERPACGLYDAAGEVGSCRLLAGHGGSHSDGEFTFTEVEVA